jgi:uncharacterized SAM-binding protein YcdF (DUF218 family)
VDRFLSKLLPLFVYPLGVAILLGVVAALLVWKGKRRSGFAAVVAGVVLLWVCATPVFSHLVRGSLEREFPPMSVDETPVADAIVILGGAVHMVDSAKEVMDLSDSFDRLLHALRLFKARKAPMLIASGGSRPGTASEAEVMATLLSELGVPRDAILLEPSSRNTYQNAVNTRAILEGQGIDKVLLVTSAFHMRRAVAAFQALDVEVVPAPTDYEVVGEEYGILNWLPGAEALFRTTYSVKEYLGLVVYWFRVRLKGS